MAEALVGTSGWSYREWVGALYPEKTPASRFLAAYAERLPTVEVHNTFRRRPQPTALAGWLAQVPATFRFAPKAHVAITHQKDLTGVEDRVRAFFASIAPLGEHLGPVLFQLPHRDPDLGRLDRILGALPPPPAPPAAFELGPAWHTTEVLERLQRAGATAVVVDRDGPEPALLEVGPVAYLRLRRDRYDDAALDAWAGRLAEVTKRRRSAYAYLRHEGDPQEAVRLSQAVRG